MVQYQVKNILFKTRLLIQGQLDGILMTDVDAQIGPALMGRSYNMVLERKVRPDKSIQLSFKKNDQSEIWTISANRKKATLGSKVIEGADILNPGDNPEDYIWSDPAEIFLRAQEYAEQDKGQKVLRRFLVPTFAGHTAAGTFQFHLEGEKTCRIESIDFSFRKKKLGFQTKSLVLKGQIDGLYPREVQLTGFEPFNFVLKGTQTTF